MKTLSRTNYLLLTAGVVLLGLASCKKENLTSAGPVDLVSGAIEVTAATPTSDAVYIVNTCPKDGKADSVAFSSLPSAVATYLSANYAGYTLKKAFAAKTSAGVVESYGVVIVFNGKPVGLQFDTGGNFVRVFEQRERRDLKNKGWHPGGRFENRDGRFRDTLQLSALPAAVKSYFATTYPKDTLVHALTVKDGNIVVISANNGLYASVFSSAGVFVKRAALPQPGGKRAEVALTSLPTVTQTYLSVTYPGFTFDKAFVIKSGSAIKGYVVMIDANTTKYCLQFDGAGVFVRSLVIR